MAKTVLITGCSAGGIGFALAKEFHKRGLIVFATARTVSKMAGLEKLSGIHLLALDVTDEASVAAAVEAVKAQTGGKLDYLVNNSGQGYFMPALDSNIEQGKKMFEVNFWGVLRVVQAFAPLLFEAKGTVVNNSSAAAVAHVPYMSLYNASKAALNMFDETLRLELAPFGVRVLTLVTGSVATAFVDNNHAESLPQNSKYYPAKAQFEAKAQLKGQARSNVQEYVKQVVNDVLGGKTGKTFRGSQAGLAAIASRWFPAWLVDRILLTDTGLDKLKP